MAEVVFDHVTRIYPGNDKPSVDDLNLDIKDGEFLVLVGPSGCGKSTTLRMLAGLEEVNKGRILIGGKDVTTMQPKDRDIAMVFQNYALYPHMTVADNMGFALKIAGTPKEEIRKRVEKAAEILCPVVSVSAWPWAVQSSVSRRSSSWMSLCPTLMPSSACRPVPRSLLCSASWVSPPCT